MDETSIGFRVTLPLAYDDAVAQVVERLEQEGFGVLTTIAVTGTPD